MLFVQNFVFYVRIKYVEVEYYFVRDFIKAGKINLEYVVT